ncbi:hypothetical protein CsSME_00026664 [Camellia sinensis var. sinensis]
MQLTTSKNCMSKRGGSKLGSGKLKKNAVFDLDQEIPTLSRLKKKGIDHSYDSRRSTTSSIEDLEVSL